MTMMITTMVMVIIMMMMADDMTSKTVTRIMMTNYDDNDESHDIDIDIDSCHLIRGAASILPEVRSLNLEMSSFQNKWQTIDIIFTFYGVTQSTFDHHLSFKVCIHAFFNCENQSQTFFTQPILPGVLMRMMFSKKYTLGQHQAYSTYSARSSQTDSH